MFLHADLMRRATARKPVGVCLIGAGKFGAMFLAQVPTIPGLVVRSIADLRPDVARAACRNVGWSAARIEAVEIGDDVEAAIAAPGVEVVVEATGHPRAGVAHARMAFAKGRHVVMVNVEADALVGPALAREAEAAGVVISMAYGDQPALIAELVDWARCSGFGVVAAGKGTKHQAHYHASTPDTVWGHYGIPAAQAAKAGMNPKMFNSFLDGTKSAIEMAALANACDLDCPEDGLAFPPCGEGDLARVLRPANAAPAPGRRGRVEVVSSLNDDGSAVPRDLRWGVFVVVEALSNYASACFAQYGVPTDPSGRFAALWRPFHMIGLELAPSILSCALDRRPTGVARAWRGDVAAVAKRDLAAGETLDGEGGYTVWGKLVTAARAAREALCPIGLAQDARLVRPVAAGQPIRLADLALDPADPLLALRATLVPAG